MPDSEIKLKDFPPGLPRTAVKKRDGLTLEFFANKISATLGHRR